MTLSSDLGGCGVAEKLSIIHSISAKPPLPPNHTSHGIDF